MMHIWKQCNTVYQLHFNKKNFLMIFNFKIKALFFTSATCENGRLSGLKLTVDPKSSHKFFFPFLSTLPIWQTWCQLFLKMENKYRILKFKKKLKTNIFHKLWCKNFKQKFSKLNPMICEKENTSWPSRVYPTWGWFDIQKSIPVIHHSENFFKKPYDHLKTFRKSIHLTKISGYSANEQ